MTTRDELETDPIGAAIHERTRAVVAPEGLRAAIQDRRRTQSSRAPLRFGVALAVLFVAALVAVFAGSSGPAHAPSLVAAAQHALRASTLPPPASRTDGFLDFGSGRVRFPAYRTAAAWLPAGARDDRIGGRSAVSVQYTRGAVRVGYSIIDGAPLTVPSGARQLVYEGVRVAVVERAGLRIVTWQRDGRTCLLATRGATLARLLQMTSSPS